MLTQPNLSFDSFEKVREKKSDLYMSDVLFKWFSDSKTYKGILHFWKKKKIKNKRGFYATSNFCDVLESYLYMLREI